MLHVKGIGLDNLQLFDIATKNDHLARYRQLPLGTYIITTREAPIGGGIGVPSVLLIYISL